MIECVFYYSMMAASIASSYATVADVGSTCELTQRAVASNKMLSVHYTAAALCEFYKVEYDADSMSTLEMVQGLRKSIAFSHAGLDALFKLPDEILSTDFTVGFDVPENLPEVISMLHEAVILSLQFLSTQWTGANVPAADMINYYRLIYSM